MNPESKSNHLEVLSAELDSFYNTLNTLTRALHAFRIAMERQAEMQSDQLAKRAIHKASRAGGNAEINEN